MALTMFDRETGIPLRITLRDETTGAPLQILAGMSAILRVSGDSLGRVLNVIDGPNGIVQYITVPGDFAEGVYDAQVEVQGPGGAVIRISERFDLQVAAAIP